MDKESTALASIAAFLITSSKHTKKATLERGVHIDRRQIPPLMVKVAHETVLRHCERFHRWLEANRELLHWRRRFGALIESGSLLHDSSREYLVYAF